MILTLENTVKIGKPCEIYSATDLKIDFPVYADTESGEVHRLKNTKDIPLKVLVEWYPAPLKVKWK